VRGGRAGRGRMQDPCARRVRRRGAGQAPTGDGSAAPHPGRNHGTRRRSAPPGTWAAHAVRPAAAPPVTAVPVTAVPVTAVPVTAVPVTAVPVTAVPVTAVPGTAVPGTGRPRAAAPNPVAAPAAAQPAAAPGATASAGPGAGLAWPGLAEAGAARPAAAAPAAAYRAGTNLAGTGPTALWPAALWPAAACRNRSAGWKGRSGDRPDRSAGPRAHPPGRADAPTASQAARGPARALNARPDAGRVTVPPWATAPAAAWRRAAENRPVAARQGRWRTAPVP
jgi:hypothetical protein